MFKCILIPTDGSEFSQRAVKQGIALAKALGAKVIAYFAAPPATPIVYRRHLPIGYAPPEDHQRIIDEATANHLGCVAKAASEAEVPCETVHSISDFPADEILKIAIRYGCDLIVMASHGQSGLRGMLLGSIAQKVINGASIPVMIVR